MNSGSGMQFRRRTAAVRLLEHLEADVAGRDLAQRQHGRLVVLPVERGLGAVGELAGALGGDQHQLEQVGDVRAGSLRR